MNATRSFLPYVVVVVVVTFLHELDDVAKNQPQKVRFPHDTCFLKPNFPRHPQSSSHFQPLPSPCIIDQILQNRSSLIQLSQISLAKLVLHLFNCFTRYLCAATHFASPFIFSNPHKKTIIKSFFANFNTL